MKRVAACMKHSRLISHKERRNVPMKKGYRASGLMVLLFFRAAVSRQTPGRPVAISNKFAAPSGSAFRRQLGEPVTVYPGDSRTYTTFISKSIDKINVVNTAGGANPLLGSYTVATPSATTNYAVTVDSNGAVAVTIALIP